MTRAAHVLAILLLLAPAWAGCMRPQDPSETPTTSATTGGEANACSPYPAPSVRTGATFDQENAFDFMIGLVCDHSGAAAQERFRVPGTPTHLEGMRYLHDALDKHSGFTVRYDNFTGADYQEIMESRQSSYRRYHDDCSDAMAARVRDLKFGNVEARGGTAGGPIFLLMAHWDSKRTASDTGAAFVSANDGPSGVGVLMELARVLGAGAVPFEVRILLTDGEDGFEDCHPLAGSTWYAETQLSAAEKTRVRSILLLDMVGDEDARFYKGCGTDSALAERVWAKAKELDVQQFQQSGGCAVTDDHVPFEERGMKTVDVIDMHHSHFTPYWHTSADTPDKVSADMLGDVGRVVEAIVRQPPVGL